MPVPFEALIPFGIIVGLFSVTGGMLTAVQYFENNGHKPRYDLDRWDRQMIARDQRLTGALRIQSDNPRAPSAFATNSEWKVCKNTNEIQRKSIKY
ncbi:uncharacterized protein T551_02701 [Pneumocystis jirovecii RU7]|uniref:NADH dehydrogenase [ubiquinone] 1 alpha subcomplex subunit 1 n=1 Tax=Pneumocystis jirovecii (strain RU7) TaxID=1408657 RepID=A0A0W4ZIU0_PNEJ7|nr:uncharacterized protein T551_02701 [Pneumocystis jirovecii RU7]KTW28282.1 hypothetical protein T551_02701 [Pneumocystis jirovecii RU7]